MQSKNQQRVMEVPLSESTISPSLSAIRERCKDLIETNSFVDFGIDDPNGDPQALPAGAYNPYNRKR